MACIGNPIMGDAIYGGRRSPTPQANSLVDPLAEFTGHALHAFLIGFTHPEFRQKLRFTSSLPNHYRKLIASLEKL
jgi:23S rRNA pseudouridine1911/1915/1917 synthase